MLKNINEHELFDDFEQITIEDIDDIVDMDDDVEIPTILLDDLDSSVSIGSSSVIGKRKEQQDSIEVDDDLTYMETGRAIVTLCDGMGGLSGGALASSLCATTIVNEFHNYGDFDNIPQFFKSIIYQVDEKVKMLTNEAGIPLNAGTTLCSVVFSNGDIYWAAVGDSRIYILRGSELLCVNEDHNYLMLLKKRVEKGALTLEEAENHPKKEALISYIGMGGVQYIDMNVKPFKLLNGDHIIICSDGLYRALQEEEIKAIVGQFTDDIQYAAEALTNFATGKSLKNQDNTSVIVVKYHEHGNCNI